MSGPRAADGGAGTQQHGHHHHHQPGDLVSLASGGGENPVPAGPPVPPAEPHVSAALVGDVPVAPQVGRLQASRAGWVKLDPLDLRALRDTSDTGADRPSRPYRCCFTAHSRILSPSIGHSELPCFRDRVFLATDPCRTTTVPQVGEIRSVGDDGFASPAVHSQFADVAAVEPPQPSISEHASVGDAVVGGDVDAVRYCV